MKEKSHCDVKLLSELADDREMNEKMKKSKSSYDLAPRTDLKFKNPMTKYQNSVENLFVSTPSTPARRRDNGSSNIDDNNKSDSSANKHKVVIYFSDAYNNICNKTNDNVSNNDISRSRPNQSSGVTSKNDKSSFMTQLKSVLEEKSKFTNKFDNSNEVATSKLSLKNKFLPTKPEIPEKPANAHRINQVASSHKQMDGKTSPTKSMSMYEHEQQKRLQQNHQQQQRPPQPPPTSEVRDENLLPSYIESIDENNVIKLKIEQNFKKATELVNLISSISTERKIKNQQQSNEKSLSSSKNIETSSIHELKSSIAANVDNGKGKDEGEDETSEPEEGYFYDWSFVQDWRRRPLRATNGYTKQLPLSSAAAVATEASKKSNVKTARKTADGQLTNSHHLIHAEARKANEVKLLSANNTKTRSDMQNHQSVTSITQKFAKEANLRGANGLPTSPINSRTNSHDIKSPVRHFGSPPKPHNTSTSAMIPERDVEPIRMPASPPTITQAPPISLPNYKPIPQRAVATPATRGVTVQSTPIKAHAALVSSSFGGKFYNVNSPAKCSGENENHSSNVSRIDVRNNQNNDVDDKPKQFHSQNPTNLPAPQPTKPAMLYQSNQQPPLQHNNIINHPPVPHQFHAQQPQTATSVQLDSTPQHVKPTKPSSLNANVTRTHHHNGSSNFEYPHQQSVTGFHKIQECNSSSDENRSSGHASMSDTGGGNGSSSPSCNKTAQLGPVPEDRLAGGVSNRNGRSRASTGKPRHRPAPTRNPWNGSGIEDIKASLQQLTMRSQTSSSTYSSLSAGSESSEPARRLGRYSSLETVNTNVTSADEFVWVDSHNRLVELQHPPWSQYCLMKVIRSGRCRDFSDRVSAEAVPRLGYLLSRALVRISREIQRLSSTLGLCSKHEVVGAYKMILCPALADSCIKACLRAAAMFFLSGDGTLKQTKSARAGLQLPVGRFHRWMVDARLGKLVHEYAAVYLCAGFENLLEEILLQCIPSDPSGNLTAMSMENSIANSGDVWGLLQPFVHLNAGRVASGALTMPRWTSESSVGYSNSNQNGNHQSKSGNNSHNSSNGNLNSSNNINTSKQEPCLLTTCVGSLAELKDLVNRSQKRSNHITLSQAALRELFYFMRCSQLEHNEANNSINGHNNNNMNNSSSAALTSATNNGNSSTNNTSTSGNNVQELCYERAYVVLPPLIEWLRVASAHTEYRHSTLIDRNDVLQAARLLLPGVDCPPRQLCCDEELPSAKMYTTPSNFSSPYNQGSISSGSSGSNPADDYIESGRRSTIELGFRLMLTGIPELMIQAMSLVSPTTRYDTLNHQGLTALMIAAIRNDDTAIQTLLDCGANPNIEVPAIGVHQACPSIHPETQHWTALTFAACRGNFTALRILLERGAKVDGGAKLSEEKCTFTPLQAACGTGYTENVAMLLAHGASSFLSTKQNAMSFSGKTGQGSCCAISVATSHGQRLILRKLLSHPFVQEKQRDVLSLEEILAEGDNNVRSSHERQNEVPTTLSKAQIRALQEAMYHSAENNYLDITIELRSMGVPWTLHCWMNALAAAHELRLDTVIDQLLQDFLQVCPDDYSQQFVTECLPLLFSIFRYSKKEGTILLLADIFSTCYGWEPIKPIKEPVLQPVNGSRIDPKFVNNSELSDVTFRVENKIFYGHKIVLVTASPRLQSLLSTKVNEGNGTPTVQINDIRYHIFELVMQYLYCGGCNNLEVSATDVLELMAASSFFQLEGLLRYTEARCAEIIDIDNVVAMYIHAKVYNASKLMEYCQGFLLQNMVALLTYDDSVKRLLFAKKIPNHDVLSGLLTTLQQRIKSRRNNANNTTTNMSQSIVKPSPINTKTNHNNSASGNSKHSNANALNRSNHNLNE